MEYQPRLFIGVGEKTCFFTLRETYLHYGRGEVLNGVFTGEVEERSYHHFNLSQDPAEAFEKACYQAHIMGLPLSSTLEGIQMEMNTIHRANKEEMENREKRIKALREQWKAEREAEFEQYFANGQYAIGKYTGKEYRSAPVSYINWIANADFEEGSVMARIKSAVVVSCIDLLLPIPCPARTAGEVGKRYEFNGTTIRTAHYDKPAFNGYGMDRVYITTICTNDGICLLVKSSSFSSEVGEKLTFKATVKEHSMYNDQMQTVVQRITVKEPK